LSSDIISISAGNSTCTYLQVIRLRGLLRQHEQQLLKLSPGQAPPPTTVQGLVVPAVPAQPPPVTVKSPHQRASVVMFDDQDAKGFKINEAPQLRDCQ
jgi:hypothetical protein